MQGDAGPCGFGLLVDTGVDSDTLLFQEIGEPVDRFLDGKRALSGGPVCVVHVVKVKGPKVVKDGHSPVSKSDNNTIYIR